jgi:hypothetical protein
MNEKLKTYFSGLNNLLDKFFVNEQKEIKELTNEKNMKMIEANFAES